MLQTIWCRGVSMKYSCGSEFDCCFEMQTVWGETVHPSPSRWYAGIVRDGVTIPLSRIVSLLFFNVHFRTVHLGRSRAGRLHLIGIAQCSPTVAGTASSKRASPMEPPTGPVRSHGTSPDDRSRPGTRR